MNWLPITWDAVATFATGFLAVGAAWWIGLRQTELMRQQHRDAAAQNQANLFLQQQSLRIELLDRRSTCIDQIRPFWTEYAIKGDLSAASINLLKPALWNAELLFSNEISTRIRDVIHSQTLLLQRKTTTEFYHQQGNSELANKWLERVFESDDAVYKAIWTLLDDMIAETRLAELPVNA